MDDAYHSSKGKISIQETKKRMHDSKFMLHIGDQIYFDVHLARKEVKEREYWNNYKYAWFHDKELRKFLQRIPNFMMMDDHGID